MENLSSSQRTANMFTDNSHVASTNVPQSSSSFRIKEEISELNIQATQKKRNINSRQTSDVQTMGSDLKDKLKRYLEIKPKIDQAAYEVVIENATRDSAIEKHQINGDFELKIFGKKVNILEYKKIYYDEKDAIKYYIRTNKSPKFSTHSLRISIEKLNEETENYLKSSESYIYDKITSDGEGGEGVFTFVEEDLLMQKLCNINKIILKYKIEGSCPCCSCVLGRLSFIAYKFALQKGKERPESWDEHKRVDENWLYEFEMRHTEEFSKTFPSDCLWNSPSLQRDSDPSVIFYIAVRTDRRRNMKKHLDVWKRIDSAVAEVIDGKKEQEVVACEFSGYDKTYFIRKIDTIRKKNQFIKDKKGLQQTFKKFVSIRKCPIDSCYIEEDMYISKIAKEFNTDENLAVKVYQRNKDSILAGNYKYDKAIKDISTYTLIKQVYFTYNEEFDLLKQLCEKKEEKLELCKCQTCASELIITLAEEYSQNERKYSNLWVNEEDKLLWLHSFIMRHGNTIFETFPEVDCEIDNVFKMVRLELLSLPPSTEKESKSSTLRLPLKKQSNLTPLFTIQTREKYMDGSNTLKLFDWNKRLYQAAEDILAQGSKMTDAIYAAIVKKYEFDSEVDREPIYERLDILKEENKYLETKGKVDKALKAIFNEKVSVDKAAEDVQISPEILKREIENFKKSESRNKKYEYDVLTSENALFTFNQEFSFLNTLISEKRKKPFYCWCYSCTMTFLYNIALMERAIKKESYPPLWKSETTREMWWSKFHTRHSKKISDIFLHFYRSKCTETFIIF